MLRSKQGQVATRAVFRPDAASRRAANAHSAQRLDAHKLLDMDMTLKRLAGDESLFRQVARVFIRTIPQLLTEVHTALASENSERAFAEAHSLKGAVAVFEAPEVLAAIVALETHANNYNVAAAVTAFGTVQVLVERLSAELAIVVEPDIKPHSAASG